MHNLDMCTGLNQPAGNGVGASRQLEDVLSRALPPLHRRAYRILRNTADAEDAVQDALLAAYTHLNQFRGQSEMSTWLNAIVSNCALMQLRRSRYRVRVSIDSRVGEEQEYSLSDTLVDSRPSPEEECCVSDLNARLTHFAGQLSPTLRIAIRLRHVENLSIQEIAQILGVPVGTVKARLARARAKLMSSMRRAMRPRLRTA